MEGFHKGNFIINPFFLGEEWEEEEGIISEVAAGDGFADTIIKPNIYGTSILNSNDQHMPQPNSFQLLLGLQEEQRVNQQPPPPVQPSLEIDSCVTADADSVAKKKKKKKEEVEMKKRKRSQSQSSSTKNSDSQRMSHIAVERNRRRLMNEYLTTLRSIMPPSYIQRGDHASIVGGAIDFVKTLEQHLQSLQAKKCSQTVETISNGGSDSKSQTPFDFFFLSPQYAMHRPTASFSSSSSRTSVTSEGEVDRDGPAVAADIEAVLIQTHVNLRILAPKRPGQLVRAIFTMEEELHLTVLHLNITSVHDSILYSLNLKVEEECKLGSADEVATAVHKIFSLDVSSQR